MITGASRHLFRISCFPQLVLLSDFELRISCFHWFALAPLLAICQGKARFGTPVAVRGRCDALLLQRAAAHGWLKTIFAGC
jgi:hypothetical protein